MPAVCVLGVAVYPGGGKGDDLDVVAELVRDLPLFVPL